MYVIPPIQLAALILLRAIQLGVVASVAYWGVMAAYYTKKAVE